MLEYILNSVKLFESPFKYHGSEGKMIHHICSEWDFVKKKSWLSSKVHKLIFLAHFLSFSLYMTLQSYYSLNPNTFTTAMHLTNQYLFLWQHFYNLHVIPRKKCNSPFFRIWLQVMVNECQIRTPEKLLIKR